MLSSAFSGWIALAINILVLFALTPYIISVLGRQGYGIWAVIGSIIGHYGLLNVGVESAVMRYVAKFSNQGRYHELNETVNTATAVILCISVLITLFAYFSADTLYSFFNLNGTTSSEFKRILILLSCTAAVTFLAGLQGAILRAHERFDWVNGLTVITTITRAGLTVVLLGAGQGLTGIAIANLVASCVRILTQAVVCARLFPDIHLNRSFISRAAARYLTVYGTSTFFIVIGDNLRFNLDSFVIAKMINTEAVAIYAVAAQIIRYIKQIVTTGAGVMAPRLAALDASGDRSGIVSLYMRGMTVTSVFSCGLSLVIVSLSGRFINWWVGEGFDLAVPVLWLLGIVYAFDLSQNPVISLLYATNKHRFYAVVNVAEGCVNLILSLLLVNSYGIFGVALGTAIPMLAIRLIVQPIYVGRLLGISQRQFWDIAAPPLGAAFTIGAAFAAVGFIQSSTKGTLLGLACWSLIIIFLYMAVLAGYYWITRRPFLLLEVIKSRRDAK